MPTFNYKAKSATGEVIDGKFDAVDKAMVINLLKGKSLYPLEVSEVSAMNKDIEFSFMAPKVTYRDLAIFCRQFHTMLNAGVSMTICLGMLKKQTENKKLAVIIGKVYEEVQKGKSLSEAMKNYKEFPPIIVNMVEVGEVSGSLDLVLERLTTHLEKEDKVKNKVKSAMTYPIIILSVTLLAVVGLVTFVLPSFVNMFQTTGQALPGPTQALLNISHLFKNIWFIVGVVIFVTMIVVGVKKLKSTDGGRYFLDKLALKLPVIGSNMKKIITSRFTRSLSLLLYTGVPLIQALDIVGNLINNQVVSRGLDKAKEEIKKGSNLAGPLEGVGIFPPMVVQMISIGEEAGTLDSTIEKVADFYDEELDVAISKIIAMIEPLMMLVMAALVGSVAVAMILPMFKMAGGVQNMGG